MLNAKNVSLVAGCLQQTLLVLIIRYSKTKTLDESNDNDGVSYLNSVAVASAEVFKLCLSLALEFASSSSSSTTGSTGRNDGTGRTGGGGGPVAARLRSVVRPMLICNDRESAKLAVPALLYLIQNNLLFVALANLSVGVYQVTNQGKLLTTALLSRIVLGRRLSGMQYASIALLGFGVAFIHLSEYYSNVARLDGGDSVDATGRNHILGLVAVLMCCVTLGLSGVCFEFVLKKSTPKLSVHCRNFHLASWSLLLAVVQMQPYRLECEKNILIPKGGRMVT